ncbi:MAG: hypothetical protein M5U28_26870 [Sandaracinaceae bacterium]|nr:hypothetical protein [Sandaracinaceae bacterium]
MRPLAPARGLREEAERVAAEGGRPLRIMASTARSAPPARSTRPSGSSVAVWPARAASMGTRIGSSVALAGSKASASSVAVSWKQRVSVGSPSTSGQAARRSARVKPPAMSTRPSGSAEAVCRNRAVLAPARSDERETSYMWSSTKRRWPVASRNGPVCPTNCTFPASFLP